MTTTRTDQEQAALIGEIEQAVESYRLAYPHKYSMDDFHPNDAARMMNAHALLRRCLALLQAGTPTAQTTSRDDFYDFTSLEAALESADRLPLQKLRGLAAEWRRERADALAVADYLERGEQDSSVARMQAACAGNKADDLDAFITAHETPALWHPIETTPKNESVLVCVWFDGHPEVQIATFHAYRDGDERGVGFWQKDADYWPPEDGVYQPTHWMPIPPAQIAQEGK